MLPDPARWYCCLHPVEKLAINAVWANTINGTIPINPLIYIATVAVALLPYTLGREAQFDQTYPHDVVTIINPGTGLPEDFWIPRAAVWSPIIAYRDTDPCGGPGEACPMRQPPFDWSA